MKPLLRMRRPPITRLVRRVSRRFKPFRRRTPPGDMPGNVQSDPQAPRPVVSIIAYGPDSYREECVCDWEILPQLVAGHSVTWVNVEGLGDAETIDRFGRLFGLHPLALEDVVHVHQRAKVEDYDERLFMVVRMVDWERADANGHSADEVPRDHVDSEQISLFLGENFVLTFQERPGRDSLEPVRTRLRKQRGRIRELGSDYLAYSLLDAVVDGYFPVLEELGGRLEELDEAILSGHGNRHLERLHRLRGDLLQLRKYLWPLRESVHGLLRERHNLFTEETEPFLRDLYDHTAQLIEVVEIYRELCADLREYHYAQVGARTNEVMKVLTIISTIFIPLSFVAGIYGMNFDPDASPWNMPELRSRYGYPITLTFMAVVGIALLFWFWRKGWIGRDEQK